MEESSDSDPPVFADDVSGADVRACTACPELVSCRSRIVNGVGPVDADVMLVGEAPGQTEDEVGKPFVGRSGSILDEALENAGFQRDEVRITNCVRCRPPENRDPYVGERERCRGHLTNELRTVKPEVVVPLGRIPVEEFVGDVDKITTVTGDVRDVAHGDWRGTAILSVHPAATLYNRDLRPAFDDVFLQTRGLLTD